MPRGSARWPDRAPAATGRAWRPILRTPCGHAGGALRSLHLTHWFHWRPGPESNRRTGICSSRSCLSATVCQCQRCPEIRHLSRAIRAHTELARLRKSRVFYARFHRNCTRQGETVWLAPTPSRPPPQLPEDPSGVLDSSPPSSHNPAAAPDSPGRPAELCGDLRLALP